VFRLAPNIGPLPTEAGDSHADRVRAAASAGFDAVEMSPFEDKDVPAARAALDETGVELTSQLAAPRVQLMLDPDHSEVYRGLDAGVLVTNALGCPRMVLGSGAGHPGRPRWSRLKALANIYRRGIDHIEGSGGVLTVAGYSGVIGLECYTDRPSADALTYIREPVSEYAR
jgi:hydroxypyruvate isomerase